MNYFTPIKVLYKMGLYGTALSISYKTGSFKPIMYCFSGLTIVVEKLLGSKLVDFLGSGAFNFAATCYNYYNNNLFKKNTPTISYAENLKNKFNALKLKANSLFVQKPVEINKNEFYKEKFKNGATLIIDGFSKAIYSINDLIEECKPVNLIFAALSIYHFKNVIFQTIHNYPMLMLSLVTMADYFDFEANGLEYYISPALKNKFTTYVNFQHRPTNEMVEKVWDLLTNAYDHMTKPLVSIEHPPSHPEL